MNTKARQQFLKVYHGQKNFVTPKIEGYYQKENTFFEISSGDFMNKKMYGITILHGECRSHFNTSKKTKEDCIYYIEKVKERIKGLGRKEKNVLDTIKTIEVTQYGNNHEEGNEDIYTRTNEAGEKMETRGRTVTN